MSLFQVLQGIRKAILLFFLFLPTLTFSKTPLPFVDTSLGSLEFNIPLISIKGKGIENLDFTIYYNSDDKFSFRTSPSRPITSPLGNHWQHSLDMVLHYAPYELKEHATYILGPYIKGTLSSSLPPSLSFKEPLPYSFPYYIEREGGVLDTAFIAQSFKQTPSLPKIEIKERGKKTIYNVDKDLFYKGTERFISLYHSKEVIYKTEEGFIKETQNGTKYSFPIYY